MLNPLSIADLKSIKPPKKHLIQDIPKHRKRSDVTQLKNITNIHKNPKYQ